MSNKTIRGVIPILVTPFGEHGAIDAESMRRQIDYNLRAGAHGLGIGLGSEVMKLSESERDLVTSLVVAEVRGRVPVVINTGGASTHLATLYSRRAQELGADALMVPPPMSAAGPLTGPEVRGYYRALSKAVSIPIVIQDAGSSPVAPSLLPQILADAPNAIYDKVEVAPTPPRVAQAVRETGGKMTILGGANATYFIEEMRRGSQGTMPGPSMTAAYVRVWDRFQAGDETGATRVFYEEILPVLRIASLGAGLSAHVHKLLLHRRGIISNPHVREPSTSVDEITRRELDAVFERVIASDAAADARA